MTNEELVTLIQSGINTTENTGLLYSQNTGFIQSVVKKYSYVCNVKNRRKYAPIIEIDELMHEAYFGLVEAVNRYDPNQGVLFNTYSKHWINQAVKRYLDNCGRVVRVPVHMQEKIHKYNQVTSFYLYHHDREPEVWEYATHLYMSEESIKNLQKYIYQDKVKSLDSTLPGTDVGGSITLGDMLTANESIEESIVEEIAQEQLKEEMWAIIDDVLKNDIMEQVIRCRFVEKLNMKEIGLKLGLKIEAVRQYEAKALRKIRSNSRTKRLYKDYLVA